MHANISLSEPSYFNVFQQLRQSLRDVAIDERISTSLKPRLEYEYNLLPNASTLFWYHLLYSHCRFFFLPFVTQFRTRWRFPLLQKWSLEEAIRHTPFLIAQHALWKSANLSKLHLFFARIGVSNLDCKRDVRILPFLSFSFPLLFRLFWLFSNIVEKVFGTFFHSCSIFSFLSLTLLLFRRRFPYPPFCL